MHCPRLTPCLAVAIGLAAALGPQEAVGQDVIHACYIQKTGVMYRIDPSSTLPGDLRTECTAPDKHVEFSWTDGAAVPSPWAGVELVKTQPSFGVGAHASISIGTSATCPEGKVVINGGYSIASPNDLEIALKSNGPSSERQWSVAFLVTNPRDENVFPIPLQVSALCVNGPGGA